MKTVLRILCIVALVLCTAATDAQNIPIGKRIPDVKPQSWLHGVRPARDAKLTCVEFYHPSSKRSRSNIDSLLRLSGEFLRKDFQVVVIASGDEPAIEQQLAGCVDEGVPVGLDTAGECFKALGVNYLPSCIIFDERQKILWAGDSRSLTPQTIKNLK